MLIWNYEKLFLNYWEVKKHINAKPIFYSNDDYKKTNHSAFSLDLSYMFKLIKSIAKVLC